MPPPVDTESSDSDESVDEIPARGSPLEEQADDDDDKDEDAEEVDGEYVVEAIVDHVFDDDDTLRLQVKWKGYERPEDLTWEPEINLAEDVKDMLEEYYQKIGGRPTRSKKPRKRARDDNSTTPQSSGRGRKFRKTNDLGSDHSVPTNPPADVERKPWEPPRGSWENDVQAVDTVERARRGLQVYLHWNNGRKSTHAIDIAKKKCPMKVGTV